jgi:hypothetical protein
MSKFHLIVFSWTCRQNSEKRIDKTQRRLKVRLKTLLLKMSLLEELNMKRLEKRQKQKKEFLQMNRKLQFLSKKLKCIQSSLILKKQEMRLLTTKDWLLRNKREKCMLKNWKFRTWKKKLTMLKEFFKLKCPTIFKRSKLICKTRHRSMNLLWKLIMKKNCKNWNLLSLRQWI